MSLASWTTAPVRGQERAFSPRRLSRTLIRALPAAVGMAILVGIWELAVYWFALPPYVLPTPQQIVSVAVEHLPELWSDSITTVFEATVGFIVGSLLGLGLGMAMLIWRRVERAVLPVYVTVNSVPMAAFGPLVTILLGIGASSKIVLIIVVVSYTVLLNTLAGLKNCDPGAIALLRSFGASDRRIMWMLQLPGALPFIFSGLKVAVVHSMILAIVVEMLGAFSGLGWSIYKATQMMNFVEAWAAVLTSVLISLIIYGLVSWFSRIAIWWPQ